MTPRETINSIVSSHADDLRRKTAGDRIILRIYIVCLLLLYPLKMIGAWLQRGTTTVAHWGSTLDFIVDAGWLIAAVLFIGIWYRHRYSKLWLRDIRCPKCSADLAYFVTSADYAGSDPKGIPERVKVCPYCTLPFDEHYGEKDTEQENGG